MVLVVKTVGSVFRGVKVGMIVMPGIVRMVETV
jgi:hypothetical protein